MDKKVMVCGVDCHPGGAFCNGYCTGESDSPPAATEEQRIAAAQLRVHKALNEAESAWFQYAGMLDVGTQREFAFRVYERVRLARHTG